LIEIDNSFTRDIQPRYFETFALFQIFERIQDGMMFRFVRDDVTTA